ncbi:hypothetical protein BGW80DRAFT_278110 [Lactifluus volemus]|nr:hypothetical protein BGW80DRAFT_278110 [Lactifluus volemus]
MPLKCLPRHKSLFFVAIIPLSNAQVEYRALGVTDYEEADKDALAQMSKFTDSSGPLFTMYCKMTEYDNKQVEAAKQDRQCRFLHQLVLCGRCRITSLKSRTSKEHRIHPLSTSRTSISFKFSQVPTHPSLPPPLNPLRSLPRHTQSG